jgi:hypothetical protein
LDFRSGFTYQVEYVDNTQAILKLQDGSELVIHPLRFLQTSGRAQDAKDSSIVEGPVKVYRRMVKP